MGFCSTFVCVRARVRLRCASGPNEIACIGAIFCRPCNATGRAIKDSERDRPVVIFKDNDFDQNPDRTFKLEATERE